MISEIVLRRNNIPPHPPTKIVLPLGHMWNLAHKNTSPPRLHPADVSTQYVRITSPPSTYVSLQRNADIEECITLLKPNFLALVRERTIPTQTAVSRRS
jgi:hypothetical protein